MPYWQLYYHLVWSVKNREPLLTAKTEPIIFGFLRRKAQSLDGTLFALNGTEDHVHIVVAIPPRLAVASFVGKVKGASSAQFNNLELDVLPTRFYWQPEYGAFSFDRKRLPNYVAYVKRQKEHHANSTIIPVLERMNEGERRLLREQDRPYALEDPLWRQELERIN